MATIQINTTNVFLNGFVIETVPMLNGNNYYLTITENGTPKVTDKLYTISNANNAISIIDSWINIGFVPLNTNNVCFQLNDGVGTCPTLICGLGVT